MEGEVVSKYSMEHEGVAEGSAKGGLAKECVDITRMDFDLAALDLNAAAPQPAAHAKDDSPLPSFYDHYPRAIEFDETVCFGDWEDETIMEFRRTARGKQCNYWALEIFCGHDGGRFQGGLFGELIFRERDNGLLGSHAVLYRIPGRELPCYARVHLLFGDQQPLAKVLTIINCFGMYKYDRMHSMAIFWPENLRVIANDFTIRKGCAFTRSLLKHFIRVGTLLPVPNEFAARGALDCAMFDPLDDSPKDNFWVDRHFF